MKNFSVVKASNLAELTQLMKKSILRGLTPFGLPAVICMRNIFNNRVEVYYQSMVLIKVNS